jgi:hypothetical protein
VQPVAIIAGNAIMATNKLRSEIASVSTKELMGTEVNGTKLSATDLPLGASRRC